MDNINIKIDPLNLTAEQLFEPDVLKYFLDNGQEDREKRSNIYRLKLRAKQFRCSKDFSALLDDVLKEIGIQDVSETSVSTQDYINVFANDDFFKDVKYNLFKNNYEKVSENGCLAWNDADDAAGRAYIEGKYGKYNRAKYDDAFSAYFTTEKAYHPVKEAIESIKWDGVPRIENLLIKWLKVSATAYARECSRLIFASGINRIYKPGCKADSVVIFVGKQGCGKSSFINWLALKQEFFAEIDDIENKEGMETLNGVFIGEISELLALTKAKECAAVKAYITRQVDHYRAAYGKRVGDYPRQCIFIGSTNEQQFLNDKTGGRRWFPIEVNCDGRWLYDHAEEIKADIAQCWAEAYAQKDTDFMKPVDKAEITEDALAARDYATEDDYREGLIKLFVANKNRVCIIDIWENALHNENIRPTKKDSSEIGQILLSFGKWKRSSAHRYISSQGINYGVQKCWERIEPLPAGTSEDIDPETEPPF